MALLKTAWQTTLLCLAWGVTLWCETPPGEPTLNIDPRGSMLLAEKNGGAFLIDQPAPWEQNRVIRVYHLGPDCRPTCAATTLTGVHRVDAFATTPDGGALVVGGPRYYEKGLARIYRFDAHGAPSWTPSGIEIPLDTAEQIKQVEPTSDGGCVLVGQAFQSTPEHKLGWALRLDADGKMVWRESRGPGLRYSTGGGNTLSKVRSMPGGGFVALGEHGGFDDRIVGGVLGGVLGKIPKGPYSLAWFPKGSPWLIALDPRGNPTWVPEVPGYKLRNVALSGLDFDPRGSSIFVGAIRSVPHPGTDGFLLGVDAKGKLQYGRGSEPYLRFPTAHGGMFHSVAALPNGHILILGRQAVSDAGEIATWVVLLDGLGRPLVEGAHGAGWLLDPIPIRTSTFPEAQTNLELLVVDPRGEAILIPRDFEGNTPANLAKISGMSLTRIPFPALPPASSGQIKSALVSPRGTLILWGFLRTKTGDERAVPFRVEADLDHTPHPLK